MLYILDRDCFALLPSCGCRAWSSHRKPCVGFCAEREETLGHSAKPGKRRAKTQTFSLPYGTASADAVYCEFRLCVTPAGFGDRTKAVGLSPYPYKNNERKYEMKTKTEILKFRVTPEEKEIICYKALSSYRLLSMYLRDCALDKKITVINGADTIAEELRRIGNNVNQIARGVNSGYVTEVNLTETRKELKAIWQSLNSLVRDVR